MENYPEHFLLEMREIYKAILERIVDTGEMLDSDVLFMKTYKTRFQGLIYKLMKGEE